MVRVNPSKTVSYVGPLVAWMGVIFFFSTDRAADANTKPVIGQILGRFLPGIARRLTPAQRERVDWNLRKSAHVTEYTILALLAYRAVAFGDPRFRHRNVVVPLLLGVAYAASDEYHQSFYPSRGAKAQDVVYDTLGVLSGVVICLWRHASAQTRTK